MKNILLTGATGLLGSQLLKLFMLNCDARLFLLIRGANQEEAENRMNKFLLRINQDEDSLGRRINKIRVVHGDVIKEDLGMCKKDFNFLKNNINQIFHCAALAEFRQPLEKVRLFNVGGTKNVLDFAMECSQLEKLHYVSTAFIAGTFNGKFSEHDLDVNQDFNNTYERSKFEAELLIRRYYTSKFSILIYRPSIIVGQYDSGKTSSFRMFYQPFRSFSQNYFEEVPVDEKTALNIIPCDTVAHAIFMLSENSNNNTFHVISPTNIPIMKLMRFASEYIGYKEPNYVDLKNYQIEKLHPYKRKILEPYIPYLNFKALFDSKMTSIELEKLGFQYPQIDNDFLARIFEYSIKSGYIFQNQDRSLDGQYHG